MFGKYTIAELGGLLSDPSRVQILTLLLDGSRHSAGKLALGACLSPQAASAHLAKLTRGGMLRMTREGRTKLFELSRPEIGYLLEALGAATTAVPQAAGRDNDGHDALRLARSCYDHLAGQVAVLLTKAWLERGALTGRRLALSLTPEGDRWFKDQGIDTFALRCQRRKFLRGCLDWTERQPHVGGALGAAWLDHCLEKRWIARITGTRALRISPTGLAAFRDLLGFEVPVPTSHIRRSA